MRRFLLLALVTLVWVLSAACTASDRDYFRNHIVVLPQKNPPHLIAVKAERAESPEALVPAISPQ